MTFREHCANVLKKIENGDMKYDEYIVFLNDYYPKIKKLAEGIHTKKGDRRMIAYRRDSDPVVCERGMNLDTEISSEGLSFQMCLWYPIDDDGNKKRGFRDWEYAGTSVTD